MTFYIDRSGMETYQRCHRKYYWERSYGGRGIVRERKALPLVVGSVVHTGLEALMLGKGIDEAVRLTLAEFDAIMTTSGIDIPVTDDQFVVAQEQRALIEGMLRCFENVALPRLLEDYEILETEKEEVTAMTPDITLLARADAVVRHKADRDLYILSFKTTATWDKRKDKSAMTDVQGISEAYSVEQRLGEKIMGIQMVHLVKGARYQDKTTGSWYNNSPLIRGYQRYGPGGVEYAHSYEWTDPMDGKKHRLGGKWEKMYVPDVYPGGVKAWIDALAHGLIQPEAGNPLVGEIIMPVPYARQESDMQDWKQQTMAETARLVLKQNTVRELGEIGPELQWHSINAAYPQYRHSCNYPSDCAFMDLCYGAKQIAQAPLENGFIWRKANHPQEETALLPVSVSGDSE